MARAPVLVVVADKVSRMAALESLGHRVATAASADEALHLLQEGSAPLVVLDLEALGGDSVAVLRTLRSRHEAPILILTAFGGAAHATASARPQSDDTGCEPASGYASRLEEARRLLGTGRLDETARTIFQAIALEPQRPEAFNLLGECREAAGKVGEAQRNYRAALALDPTFRPARDNLHRTVWQWTKTWRVPRPHGRP